MSSKEEWKDIEGYEGYYQISNQGSVRSVDRKVKDKNRDRFQTIKGKELKVGDNGKGYKVVYLLKEGKKKNYYVHRLVAKHFLENPLNLEEINHKDLNKSNNCVDNLEWITQKGNKEHYRESSKYKKALLKTANTKKENYKRKVENLGSIVEEKYIKERLTIRQIARDVKASTTTISKILSLRKIPINKKPRKNIGFIRNKLGRFVRVVYE